MLNVKNGDFHLLYFLISHGLKYFDDFFLA